jgi:hypothetical protein
MRIKADQSKNKPFRKIRKIRLIRPIRVQTSVTNKTIPNAARRTLREAV